jgi:zinc and cadmium transporter
VAGRRSAAAQVSPGLLYAALAGLGDILGGILVAAPKNTRRTTLNVLTGFGGGFLLAVALVEMLPRAFDVPHGITAVIIGYLAVHLTQHSFTPHFHFGEETHGDAMVSRSIGGYALAGLLPHSFFDGVAIASGFLNSPELGMLIFVGVLLHKVPTGVSLASVMLASGNSRRSALAGVVGLAVVTVLGALMTPMLPLLATYGLALAAGVTIYVAASNLVPEAQHERSWLVQGGLFAGVAVFYLVRLVA